MWQATLRSWNIYTKALTIRTICFSTSDVPKKLIHPAFKSLMTSSRLLRVSWLTGGKDNQVQNCSNLTSNKSLLLSVSSSFVHGLSTSTQPLKTFLSNVRSTVAFGFSSWHIKSSLVRTLEGFLKVSGNSFSGHSQTLQSRNRHTVSYTHLTLPTKRIV